MLERLYIKNIALIDEADIEFCGKLNILSGETGSGKSVILDSINFVLGSKTDKSMIRYGESTAQVRAEFSVSENCDAVQRLHELDIDSDGEIIITRRFSIDGKSSIKINGNTVTVTMLKSVTQHLVDVHGQSEHFYLLDERNQLKVIDGLCGAEGEAIKEKLLGLITEKRAYQKKVSDFGGNAQERERKLDLLLYQINEIEKANIKEGELEDLLSQRLIFNHAEKLLEACSTVQNCLSEDGGGIDSISTAIHQLAPIAQIGQEYTELLDRLENLRTEAEDIASTSADLADGLNFDERQAEYVEERISLIRSLIKKYGTDEGQILAFLKKAKEEYNLLSEGAEAIEKFEKAINALNEEIYLQCLKLSELRRNAALMFCTNVENELKTLNIPNAKFTVYFKDFDKNTANLNSTDGSDELIFMFSANKGEPLKPLNKVISGGEMSRFMLAIKTQLKGDSNGISTYIFDEIDSGISGYTAKTVAEKFLEIAEEKQIIAVSHLPQVSAASDSQYLIYKTEENGKTITRINKLSESEKVDEIIRLTGSVDSAAARKHAEELISQFKNK